MSEQIVSRVSRIDEEQLPVAADKLHGWKHFAGIYASEHVAATEFVIGATFVALGASTMDIILGLLIGNLLAVMSWMFITTPIAVQTRLSLYTYLNKIAGDAMTRLYNWANVLIFGVISAAMITVSASAVRFLFNIPAQLNWFPTDFRFVLVVIGVGVVVVIVAIYGFSTLADFSSICGPWLFVMFVAGALVLLPQLSYAVLGETTVSSFSDYLVIADRSIWTGKSSLGGESIGLVGTIGFAWAANTLTHVGLIDMAILRYAKKVSYGVNTAFGMLFGHYIAWIAAGIMGAGAAVVLNSSIIDLDPGDVAYYALGASGFVIVIVAGWTTANANLYRAGLAAQAIFRNHSRERVTLIVGLITVAIACFPFVFSKMLPLLTYGGLIVVPVGAIVFTEHFIFPKLGLTRYWASYRKLTFSTPAIAAWAIGLTFGFGLNALDMMSFYYLFIPTWFVTAIFYTMLAKQYGASEKYLAERERVSLQKAEGPDSHTGHSRGSSNSAFTTFLDVVSWLSLLVISSLAIKVMFYSPTLEVYESNKLAFHNLAFICTLIYFACAYWAFKRKVAS
jgi:NCS1 family nucleobase:cation symporter-1